MQENDGLAAVVDEGREEKDGINNVIVEYKEFGEDISAPNSDVGNSMPAFFQQSY